MARSNQDETQITEVHDAILHRDLPRLQRALAPDPRRLSNAELDCGLSPLNHAIFTDFHEGIAELLAAGSVAAHVDGQGSLPMHSAAVREGYVPITTMLLAHGANINQTSRFGLTALDIALSLGDNARIDYLKSVGGISGRKPDRTSSWGPTLN